MTKLRVVIELPVSMAGKSRLTQPVRCTGVVLRQQKLETSAGYRTALYFSDLEISDRKRIAEFVLRSMFRHRPGLVPQSPAGFKEG